MTLSSLDMSIIAAAAFDTIEGYARFTAVQYPFHRHVETLYDDAALQRLLPGLAGRRRLPLIASDLTDLGRSLPHADDLPAFVGGQAADTPTALG